MTSLESTLKSDPPFEGSVHLSSLAFLAGSFFAGRTIFVLVAARWLNLGTEVGVLASFAGSAVTALAAALCGFGPAKTRITSPLSVQPFAWVLFYLAFAGISLSWSASSALASSALYWCALVGDVGIVVLLARSNDVTTVVHSLLKGFIAASCALSVIAWTMPAAADLRLGDLDYFNTNQIGNLCALSLLMCGLLASRGDTLPRIAPWLLGLTLIRSLSKSTLIAMIACMLYRMMCDPENSRARKWIYTGTAILLALGFWSFFSAYYNVYTTAGNQAETLTGRTAIWAWAFDAALAHPWVGNGFDAMWHVAPPFGGELFDARHAENELLQQFFAYGVCGLALLLGIYGSLYRSFRRQPHSSARVVLISFVLYAMVRGLAEAEPFDLLLPLWVIVALALLTHAESQTQTSVAPQHTHAALGRGVPAC